MKTVCIVGAGPGGLVAAKTLLEAGGFAVTIYEQNHKLGGLWMFEEGAKGNKYLSADTPTNLSRYAVSFSDLSWESVPLKNGRLSMFPRASQVGEYLEEYRRRFIPADAVKYGYKVKKSKLVDTNATTEWEVLTVSEEGEETSRFDFLINAAGFFANPVSPEARLPPQTKATAVHSSTYNTLADLFPDPSVDVRDTSILVVGGANSGGEAAASIAFQLSASLYGPEPSKEKRFEGVYLKHLVKRPVYGVPPYIPSSTAPTFAPLDFQFYDLKWAAKDAPITSKSGLLAPDAIAMRHLNVQGLVGDQSDLQASALDFSNEGATAITPFAALSETYSEFVRSGSIQPIHATLSSLRAEDKTNWVSAEAAIPDGTITNVPRISAVVYATGYSANLALEFIPSEVKEKLEFDPSSSRLPILLQNWQTLNPTVPSLGFIGFYVGPYWGIMEMQARILALLWQGETLATADILPQQPGESFENLRKMRDAMAARSPAVPQYWFSDYTAYMEELSRHLELERNDAPFEDERDGPVSPARYISRQAGEKSRQEAQRTMHTLYGALQSGKEGKYRARAAFRGLQGRWDLQRMIVSSRTEMPSGSFSGDAWFHPRAPTDSSFDGEYLYIESGKFRSDSGFEMTATRRYVYRYKEEGDVLSVWFVKPDDGLTVDYLFHNINFAPVAPVHEETSTEGRRLIGEADHLCEEDMYETSFSFGMEAVRIKDFEIHHRVKGPAKDYIAMAKYKRAI